MAITDGLAEVRIDGALYPAQRIRIEDSGMREIAFQAAAEKYLQIAERARDGIPDSLWLFRAERRS